MSLTAINPQDEGGASPSAPAPVQSQETEEASTYRVFCRELEDHVKHQPHSMFSPAQCSMLFKTYERGLAEIREIQDQRSHTIPTGPEHEVEDGEV